MHTEKGESVLVCVTDQPSCRRLISAGVTIAQSYHIPVKVVAVLKSGLVSAKTADVLQTLYNISTHLGAEMTVYFNDDPALTVAVHASQTGATHLVSGAPGANSSAFIETLKGLLPDLPITIVDDDQHMYTFPAMQVSVND